MLAAIRVTGAITSALAVSAGLAMDSWAIGPDWPGARIALLGFLFFIGFVGWGWGRAEWKLNRGPKITVEPLIANQRATLVIRNSGGKAEFTAKARVRDTSLVDPEWYTMYWESESHKTSASINRDGLQSILVGRASDYFDEKRFIFTDGLILYKMGGEGEQEFGCLSGVTRRIDATTTEGWAEDRCAVDVLITAEPSLGKPFEAQYCVERVRGREEIRLTCLTCESPVLNVWGV